ncbi:MAG: NTP transferase domain-containing protein [Deltaproteobacteria bacterium]|nr:NTP transferase domain-containing protein [Deltaproteobacteria bacterium]
MKCIIMAGGFGTRLRPLTNNLPKPMVPMAGRPMIEHIVELVSSHGFKDLTTLLYFQPESIVDCLGTGKKFGSEVSIEYVSPTSDLGTAGSVANAMRLKRAEKTKKTTSGEPTLVISGDVLTDIDLAKALAFHKKKKSLATIILTRVPDPLSFGIVITEKTGQINRFLEKPSWGEVFSDTINTGIYILDDKVLDFIPKEGEFDFSNDLFPLLLNKKKALYGYVADGYWKDVGSLQEYRQANMDILRGRVSVGILGERVLKKKAKGKNKASLGEKASHDEKKSLGESEVEENTGSGIWIGDGAKVDYTAKMEGSVIIGAGSVIESGARVENSVIGDNCLVSEGTNIVDSVIWDNVGIGRSASLQENVVGDSTTIKEGAYLGVGVVVSDHCRIGKNSTVKANVKVWPHKEVDDDATLASSLIWGQKWGRKVFSTYGVTGLANIELSPEFAAKLGAAYGASLPKGSYVSTSRDLHKTSRMLNRAVMTGILSTGVNVHDYGVTPMPVVRYLSKGGIEIGGIHTRRSPFDATLIDLKFFDDSGLDLHPGQEKTIEKLFFREDFIRAPIEETGEIVFPVHAMETYQNGFMNSIDAEVIKKAGFRIIVDYSHGSSSKVLPSILGKLNCECIALNANLDPGRVTRSADEFENSLKQLSSIVRSLGADMGFLLDAGGEKIFLVDETGGIIDGSTSLDIITLLALKTAKRAKKKGRLAVPVTASRAVEELASSYGYEVLRTKTTPRGIMEAAIADDTFFVGEETGGFIFPEFQPVFDGIFALAKTLEMLAREKTLPHRLLREIPPSFMVKEEVPCKWESKGMIMRRLAEDSQKKKTVLIDGIRINFGDDWLIAYPSQSHSYFHVVAEASTGERAKELASIYAEKIRGWQVKEKTI